MCPAGPACRANLVAPVVFSQTTFHSLAPFTSLYYFCRLLNFRNLDSHAFDIPVFHVFHWLSCQTGDRGPLPPMIRIPGIDEAVLLGVYVPPSPKFHNTFCECHEKVSYCQYVIVNMLDGQDSIIF